MVTIMSESRMKTFAQTCKERADKATEASTQEIKRQLAIKKSEITAIGYPYVILDG